MSSLAKASVTKRNARRGNSFMLCTHLIGEISSPCCRCGKRKFGALQDGVLPLCFFGKERPSFENMSWRHAKIEDAISRMTYLAIFFPTPPSNFHASLGSCPRRTKLGVVLGEIGTHHAAIVAKVNVEFVASKPKNQEVSSSRTRFPSRR